MVVPAVLVVRITDQYKTGWYFLENNCAINVITKKDNKITELNPYPILKVMDNISPAVSPNVVAQIFIIQKMSVISATFFIF